MEFGLGYIGIGIGAGLAILGAGLGIGKIGGSAVEGISRQPDAAGSIQTGMIISGGGADPQQETGLDGAAWMRIGHGDHLFPMEKQ